MHVETPASCRFVEDSLEHAVGCEGLVKQAVIKTKWYIDLCIVSSGPTGRPVGLCEKPEVFASPAICAGSTSNLVYSIESIVGFRMITRF